MDFATAVQEWTKACDPTLASADLQRVRKAWARIRKVPLGSLRVTQVTPAHLRAAVDTFPPAEQDWAMNLLMAVGRWAMGEDVARADYLPALPPDAPASDNGLVGVLVLAGLVLLCLILAFVTLT